MSDPADALEELEAADPSGALILTLQVSKWAEKLDRSDPGWWRRRRDFGATPWPALAELWRREVRRRQTAAVPA